MNSLRGRSGHKLYWQPASGTLIQESPDGNELQNIYYFYGCGTRTQTNMIEEGGTDRKSWTYNFMKFFGREAMEDFGVRF